MTELVILAIANKNNQVLIHLQEITTADALGTRNGQFYWAWRVTTSIKVGDKVKMDCSNAISKTYEKNGKTITSKYI